MSTLAYRTLPTRYPRGPHVKPSRIQSLLPLLLCLACTDSSSDNSITDEGADERSRSNDDLDETDDSEIDDTDGADTDGADTDGADTDGATDGGDTAEAEPVDVEPTDNSSDDDSAGPEPGDDSDIAEEGGSGPLDTDSVDVLRPTSPHFVVLTPRYSTDVNILNIPTHASFTPRGDLVFHAGSPPRLVTLAPDSGEVVSQTPTCDDIEPNTLLRVDTEGNVYIAEGIVTDTPSNFGGSVLNTTLTMFDADGERIWRLRPVSAGR